MSKPGPRIFKHFLDRTGQRKEALLFIDDSEANVATARRLGWDAVRFVSAELLEQELAARRLL
jgi:2-haloacid dehalogenase